MSTAHAEQRVEARPSLARGLVRLARPRQWAKSAFVFIGPAYGLAVLPDGVTIGAALGRAFLVAVVFALASSGAYAVNDVLDAEQDRAHPRKRTRPVASGAVTPRQAWIFAGLLFIASLGLILLLPSQPARLWVAVAVGVYIGNVAAYSAALKHMVIADVMSLALGFVLRMLGGCAAVGVSPSVWLLNCTFFLAMFLAFGKRLGERRALGGLAAEARRVQSDYTDGMLQMAVVVTGVATLVGYTVYVAEQRRIYDLGFNLLWITVLPATYGLFRSVVLLDRGSYDDPTDLALRDRPFQASALVFAGVTAALLAWRLLRPTGG